MIDFMWPVFFIFIAMMLINNIEDEDISITQEKLEKERDELIKANEELIRQLNNNQNVKGVAPDLIKDIKEP